MPIFQARSPQNAEKQYHTDRLPPYPRRPRDESESLRRYGMGILISARNVTSSCITDGRVNCISPLVALILEVTQMTRTRNLPIDIS